MTPASVGNGPPDGSYYEAAGGWLLNSQSSEWMYKPSNGVYFHSPSESLWKRSCSGHGGFFRLDELSTASALGGCGSMDVDGGTHPPNNRCYELAVVALNFGGANSTTLLRVCFTSWSILRSETKTFEDMQRDLLVCCEAARSTA